MSTARTNLQDDNSEDIIQLRKNLKLETHRRHRENKISAQEINNLKQKIIELNNQNEAFKNTIETLKHENRSLTSQTQENASLKETIKDLTHKSESLEHLTNTLMRQNTFLIQKIQEKDKARKELIELTINPAKSRMINLQNDEDDNISEEIKSMAAESKSNDSNHSRYNPLSWLGFNKKKSADSNTSVEEPEPNSASPSR